MLDVHTPHTRHTSHTSGLKVFVRKLVHVLIVLCLLLSPSLLLLLPLLSLLSLLHSGATRLFFTAGDVCECGYLTSACYTCPTQSEELTRLAGYQQARPQTPARRHSNRISCMMVLQGTLSSLTPCTLPHLCTLGIQYMV